MMTISNQGFEGWNAVCSRHELIQACNTGLLSSVGINRESLRVIYDAPETSRAGFLLASPVFLSHIAPVSYHAVQHRYSEDTNTFPQNCMDHDSRWHRRESRSLHMLVLSLAYPAVESRCAAFSIRFIRAASASAAMMSLCTLATNASVARCKRSSEGHQQTVRC